MTITADIPIRLQSEANMRDHWAVRNQRKRKQQAIVALVLGSELRGRKLKPPYTVTLTRLGKRQLDSHDNLRSSMKGCVDEIAKLLGIDDADEQIHWVYEQAKSKDYWLRVKLEAACPT